MKNNSGSENGEQGSTKSSGSGHRHMLVYLLPVIVYAILIFYVSVLPVGDAPPPEEEPEPSEIPEDSPARSEPARSILFMKYNIPSFDVLANIMIYLGFGILLYRSLEYYFPPLGSDKNNDNVKGGLSVRLLLLVLVIGLIYSTLNELAQLNLASRVSDALDVVYNTVGAFIGALVFITWEKRTGRKKGK